MNLALRPVFFMVLLLALFAFSLVPLVERLMHYWSVRDLNIRSHLVVKSVRSDLLEVLSVNEAAGISQRQRLKTLTSILEKGTEDERLLALGLCSSDDSLLVKSKHFPEALNCKNLANLPGLGEVLQVAGGSIHVTAASIMPSTIPPTDGQGSEVLEKSGDYRLVVVHDMSYVDRRSRDTKIYMGLVFLAIGIGMGTLMIFLTRWSSRTWTDRVRSLLGDMREGTDRSKIEKQSEFLPILKDVRALVRELETSRQYDDLRISWDASALKDILSKQLYGERIIVVSNRQPYIHNWVDGAVKVQRPASGLCTALEPVLRACSGTWVAHGNGTADRAVVDKQDRVRIEGDGAPYNIRRVWMSDEEEKGYYYGFANEGLWPLCHIAHTRPQFRSADWHWYGLINQRFAQTVIEEAVDEAPIVLVQDYHLALVPHLIRQKLEKATILSFWHIPWPNPESYGICPWREELLEGLLGSSIVGFHTQFHCNNFLECIDRYLEARIDRETNTVFYKGFATQVRAYPISIEWPLHLGSLTPREARSFVEVTHKLSSDHKIFLGVDRLDYTKGILERLEAFGRFLERYPEWRQKASFLQIGAPTRSQVAAYQHFATDVSQLVETINQKYGTDDWLPVQYLPFHHESELVYKYLMAADVCLVTSLHDGMNLVAKEYIAAHTDEKGVLILSYFTGASRELAGALLVNPYAVDQLAQAMFKAVTMEVREQRERMLFMRSLIREYNVFRWAGRMLLDASRLRLISSVGMDSSGPSSSHKNQNAEVHRVQDALAHPGVFIA